MLEFLKKFDILKVVEKISNAWKQIRPEPLRKSWQKFIPLEDSSLEESAVCLESILNDDFVEKFAALNIVSETSDIDRWFQNDGPGYEHIDNQGIVDLVIAPAEDMQDEEVLKKKTHMKMPNFQIKRNNPKFLTQKPCECLMIA